MKTRFILIASIFTLISSCAPGANSNLEDHLVAYNWKVTYMESSNTEITPVFTPYVFNFEGNNTVIATKIDSTFTGTWNRSNSSQENPKIELNFGSHYELSLLNYDWQQKSRTDFIIELVDEMGGSGSESVTFEKLP
jgi:hypothetical protein